jgi:hypothetical protein
MQRTERKSTLPTHRSASGYRCLAYIVLTICHILTTHQIVSAPVNYERVKRIRALPDNVCEPQGCTCPRGRAHAQ